MRRDPATGHEPCLQLDSVQPTVGLQNGRYLSDRNPLGVLKLRVGSTSGGWISRAFCRRDGIIVLDLHGLRGERHPCLRLSRVSASLAFVKIH